MSDDKKPDEQQVEAEATGHAERRADDEKPVGEDAKPDEGHDEAALDAKDAAGGNTADGEAEDEHKKSKPAAKKQKRDSTSQGGSEPKRRRSTRGSRSNGDSADPKKIVEFLLSDEALVLMDKLELGDKGSFKFPRDRLNPFQELLAACMISKPFSHVLGTRAINELFAEEHSALDTPKKTVDFGQDKIHEIMEKAKTLHRQKTAAQLFGIAETCANDYGDDASLDKLREEANKDADEEHDLIAKKFKGYGPKTVDIFFRRVQVEWEEVYPFADESTLEAARHVGLNAKDAEALAELVKEATGVEGKELRGKFGRVVDVVVYLSLEGKTDEAVEAIGSS